MILTAGAHGETPSSSPKIHREVQPTICSGNSVLSSPHPVLSLFPIPFTPTLPPPPLIPQISNTKQRKLQQQLPSILTTASGEELRQNPNPTKDFRLGQDLATKQQKFTSYMTEKFAKQGSSSSVNPSLNKFQPRLQRIQLCDAWKKFSLNPAQQSLPITN